MRPYAYLCENRWIKEKKQARQYVLQYLGRVTDLDILDLNKIDFTKCKVCGKAENLVPDHIIPLIMGGTNKPDNIQCLCYKCNQKKGNLMMPKNKLVSESV
jgi:5-methylcytosine-specific restriction endonuclease McrA